MTMALIAGAGNLPTALLDRLNHPILVCALEGTDPAVPIDLWFRIERIGSFLKTLRARGVDKVCMAGGIARPDIQWRQFDGSTLALVPVILRAMRKGDDGALRAFIGVLEAKGFSVMAAHQIAPDLLIDDGFPTVAKPQAQHCEDAKLGAACLNDMGRRDSGQACVVRDGKVVIEEGRDGTDAMIARVVGQGGILFKGPKPGQDRRADLPVIGSGTARLVVRSGLDGIVIEARGVMVLDQPDVLQTLNAAGKFLWVRKADA